ncbi:hypothetical protein Y1Q_0010320 [Alligator mississippiensis]|uniref:Uncharacterized protein n=1 Tax=Alligator mississippiensis TaxID=8496 RepID=A0A151NMD1_ALLMI|nr:hypothetical protein Y1Q_0010320 [Alligator mississippiensis]
MLNIDHLSQSCPSAVDEAKLQIWPIVQEKQRDAALHLITFSSSRQCAQYGTVCETLPIVSSLTTSLAFVV